MSRELFETTREAVRENPYYRTLKRRYAALNKAFKQLGTDSGTPRAKIAHDAWIDAMNDAMYAFGQFMADMEARS